MSYEYWIPDNKGNKTECVTEENAVVIVGANGSGKSKLGAWIELQEMNRVHRIGAQRNLNFSENLQLKSYRDAENMVLYGDSTENVTKGARWEYGNRFTTMLHNDYNDVLAALIALKNNENDIFSKKCKNSRSRDDWPNAPETSIDKLQKVWCSVFSQRELIEDDSKFYSRFINDGREDRYSATQMSDGERAVLYLAAQVLCVPSNKILIIDEPEVHLHRSIMNRLWKALEQERADCLFIYITHDVDFAAAHGKVDKYWVKDYKGGNVWTIEKIIDENLPEQLLLEILGSRKNVLFVEGEKSSYDFQLYSQLYQNYFIVPSGSCSQVISRTKAFRNSTMLHDCKVYGLIDRDYRSEHEIQALREDGVFALDVAEVENLFLVEELIRLMAKQFGEDESEAFDEVKKFVIDTKFKGLFNRQICQSVVAEIKYRLSTIEIDNKNEDNAKNSLNAGLNSINYDAIKGEKTILFENAKNTRNYKEVLKVFNEKGIAAEVGTKLGIDKREYQAKVIKLLSTREMHDAIASAVSEYLPSEIPR